MKSKRIEELEKEIKEYDVYFSNYIYDEEIRDIDKLMILRARLEERKQAEKEFREKINKAKKQMIEEFGFEETKRHRGILTDEFGDLNDN